MYKVGMSDKALRDFAYRALASETSELRPGTTPAELRYFCDQLSRDKLTEIYYMMFKSGLVE